MQIIKFPEENLLDAEIGNIIVVGDRTLRTGHKLIIVVSENMQRIITLIDTFKTDIITKREEKMGKNKIEVRYDKDGDNLYILSAEGPVKDTVEIGEDVFVEIGENDKIIGIEIWQARKHIFPELIKYIDEVRCQIIQKLRN